MKTILKRVPNFMVIGAAKSGSSTLYAYLKRHTGIAMSSEKEPCFFSHDDVWSRGWTWYNQLFDGAQGGQLLGEASTTYTRWPHTADASARIHKHCPDVKLIYIVRHPVDRSYSHYGHHMRNGITMTFEEALEHDQIYVDCSFYMMQLDRYLRFFEPDQILVLLQSDLRKDPGSVLDRLQAFLALKRQNLRAHGELHKNVGATFSVDQKITPIFQAARSIPGFGSLSRAIPADVRHKAYRWCRTSAIGKLIARQHRLPPMQPETRQRLLELFEPDIQRLERFTGLTLPEWRT